MSTRIGNPFAYFTDKAGDPLTGGTVYIGTTGNDPEISPVSVFADEALTIAVPQPIPVIAGLLSYDGNPVHIYCAETGYSIRARDVDGAQVFYTATAIPGVTDFQPLDADLTAIAALATTAFGRALLTQADGAAVRSYIGVTTPANPTEAFPFACSDETTAITTGVKVTFRWPYAFTVTKVKASLTTPQTSGSTFTVNIKKNGTTILSTLITIDNTEDSSETAGVAPVISVPSIAADDKVTIEVSQIGDGTAKGLKVTMIGQQP